MISKFLNYILVLIVFISCFGFKAEAQDIQVMAKLDQTMVRIGDQTKLHLTVEQPAKEQVNFPKLTDTLTGKVQIIASSKIDTIYDKNDHNKITVTQSFTVTCFDAGTYAIPSFSFGSKSGVLKTNELTLDVQSVKVDTTKSIYDIKQPLAVSYTFMDWLRDNWYLVVIPIIVVLLIIGLIWYLRKRPKRALPVVAPKPGLPFYTITLNQLKELKDKKLWQQNEVKQYYSELSDVLREYLEKRYQIKTQEKTTDEIFDGLKIVDLAPENKEMLRQLLKLSDLVKFAKEKPLPIENEESIEKAIDFVLKTQQAVVSANHRPSATSVKPGNIEGGNAGEHI